MTDLPPRSPLPEPSGDEADLLASLYLDGEASAEERTLVEADPGLMARVEQFRLIAAESANVAVPPGLADQQIAAALDAFDALTANASEASPADVTDLPQTTPVTSLADRRARRSSLPTWIGAAAVSALVIGGLGVLAARGSGGDDEVASIETSVASSAANAAGESAGDMSAADAPQADSAESADQAASTAEAEIDAEGLMSRDEAADDGAATESIEEEGAGSQVISPEEAAAFYVENGPVDLATYEASTATEYYDQLRDLPLQPVAASPCADSPLVAGLFQIDSFVPVLFEQQQASLVVQAGSPATALIIGPTCEIVLD